MAQTVVMQDGHVSLEYDQVEQKCVRNAIQRIDPSFSVIKHISSSIVKIKGIELTSVIDEMGCALISGTADGDDIIKEIISLLGCDQKPFTGLR
jgi:hypothetical protein